MCCCILHMCGCLYAGMKVTCKFALENNQWPDGGVSLHNITFGGGYNETVAVLPPGNIFSWQQVYPITAANVFDTYLAINATARGYIARPSGALPYDLEYSFNEWLPVRPLVNFRLTPTLQPPSKCARELAGQCYCLHALSWIVVTLPPWALLL